MARRSQIWCHVNILFLNRLVVGAVLATPVLTLVVGVGDIMVRRVPILPRAITLLNTPRHTPSSLGQANTATRMVVTTLKLKLKLKFSNIPWRIMPPLFTTNLPTMPPLLIRSPLPH